jgi:uncharacterized protein
VAGGRHSTPDNQTDAAPAAPGRDVLSLPGPAAPDVLADMALDVSRPPRPAKPDPNRVRLCVVTRTELPPAALIRFVAGPDDRIVPDLAGKLPGRGVWVSATRAAVAEAAKRGLFAKSLKRQIKTDADLPDRVDALLLAEARQVLALANKAGLLTTGFSKVEIALERGAAVALISARDASADGRGKLSRKFAAIRAAAGQPAPVLEELTSDELGLAIGGSNVIHASLAGGVLAQRFIVCCHRLGHYRGISDGTTGSLGARLTTSSLGVEATDGQVGGRVPPIAAPGSTGRTHDSILGSIEETNSEQAGTDTA